MDVVDLKMLLDNPEGETLDFKAKCYDLRIEKHKRDFAKDLGCLANTPREGNAHIVLGVKKQLDGSCKIHGIDIDIDDANLQSVANSLLEPIPRFNYEVIPYCSVRLGLITIYQDQQYPAFPRKTLDKGFIEGRMYFRRGSQNAPASTYEQRRIWDWFSSRNNSNTITGHVGDPANPPQGVMKAEALLLGPVEALGLTASVKEAERLTSNAPAEAAKLYERIASALRGRFPGHADRFDQRLATALKTAGASHVSHDILMKLAIRDLWERAEPKLTPSVGNGLDELHSKVNKIRQFRGSALVHFGKCHEYAGELEKLAECFDGLGVDDEFSPVIATLFAEAALADRAFQVVLDRNESLQSVAAGGDSKIEVRLHAALGDAGVAEFWPTLIKKAESLRFPPAEGAYMCIRGARWSAWNGQVEKAESLYRLAMKLGSEADLDLDVENALWSLNVLYSLRYPFDGLSETNLMARTIGGSHSYVTLNARTQQRSYQYLANRKLPDAHLWAQYRLLESLRSGCLMDELESYMILARIYAESDEFIDALEHAVLGGSQELVKESAPRVKDWPAFLADMVTSKAPWVRQNALLALGYVGDLAPPELARGLVTKLVRQLREDAADIQIAPTLLKALSTIILEATDEDLIQLMPILEGAAVREREAYLLTDPGVMTLAARLYRFRPNFRQQAASIFGEMAIGAHTGDWSRALEECGDDKGELIAAIEQVAERENIDVARTLSDLGHLTPGTRALWSQRLQFVTDHPLGKRSRYEISPRYDVPVEFLREQTAACLLRYVHKLVAIGSDGEEMVINRAAAFAVAGNVIHMLPCYEKKQLFKRVQPMVEQQIQISQMDLYNDKSQHPLNRFRVSFGSAAKVRESAGWLLGRAATNSEERSVVVALALNWVRSEDSSLQYTGALLLSQPNFSPNEINSAELAKHTNPSVRRASLWMTDMQTCPDTLMLEDLAIDREQKVRIAVAQALSSFRSIDIDSYERIRARLNADPSALVRACALTLPRRCNLPSV